MKKYTIQKTASAALILFSLSSLALPALAADAPKNTTALLNRSTTAITNRITELTKTEERIKGMTHLSDAAKTSVIASLDGVIAELNTLAAKIKTDSAADLKTDAQSVTKAYRVYALMLPKARILVAADKVGSVADMITAMEAKLEVRITALQNAGKDITAITALKTDMTAKVADAKAQAAAAAALVANLALDNGDKTVMTANETALKQARADLNTAEQDLKAAQKDVKGIIAALKGSRDSKESDTNKGEKGSDSHQ